MGFLNWKKSSCLLPFLVIFVVPVCWADTDPRDVNAINSLYASLGFPPIPGWVPMGGDPCGLSWQGVQCVNSNITGLVLSGANLGGQLSEDLGSFASIIQIDLSNNHIGGSIPSNLPTTLQQFFLSGNQLTGSIPDSLSSLGQLLNLSFNDNNLTGAIPDSFLSLKTLSNMDLSGNRLSGPLPASMANLASLTTLYLQNNQLTGILDVLQDLPLKELNVENNLFSGPIPDKILNIPNFRRAGNPFNTSVLPSPPASPPSLSPSGAPTPRPAPGKQTTGPSTTRSPHLEDEENIPRSTNGTPWIPVVVVAVLVILALGICLLMCLCCKRRRGALEATKSHEMYAYSGQKENPKLDQSLQKPSHQGLKATEVLAGPVVQHETDLRRNDFVTTPENSQSYKINRKAEYAGRREDYKIDISSELDVDSLTPPPPPPFPLMSTEVMVSDPILPLMTTRRLAKKRVDSVNFFTIASLQQYTDSFSQENLIGGGILGTVYKAKFPSGKHLAVKKLDTAALTHQSEEEFLELVSNVSKLKHPNILELVGYCAEHGQRLLIYEYCSNGTLHEALHSDDELHRNLSWNVRMRLALQAARALEYLHEACRPIVMHRNFKAANILLDDDLGARVSDCGLAPLLPPNYATAQLQAHGYGAPELELGGYSYQSDVYSFGVVMLELLTGRKSYDRSRPRGEQSLVRWAIPRLHDISALSKMVDPSLKGAYPSKSLSRFADIISLCIQREPEFRPPMSEIVQSLLQTIP